MSAEPTERNHVVYVLQHGAALLKAEREIEVYAWRAYGLPTPHRHGGWFGNDRIGYVTHVEQGAYGHVAKKATWLYAFGIAELPQLKWGSDADTKSKALVSWCGNHVSSGEVRPRVGKKAAAETPTEFRDVLISIARNSH